jgi:aminomethyltransferase
MDLKRVALHDLHVALGAKMVPFAGFEMPVRYSSDKEEHQTVRQGVGIFDVSHMGEFLVEGPHALDLIQYVSSNDASKLVDGQAQYSCLPNAEGGIVDDLLVYKIADEKYLLVVNAGNIQKDWDWIALQNEKFGASLRNLSDAYSLFAVQGPRAMDTLQKLTHVDLAAIPYYHFVVGPIGQVPHAIISATGYTGAGGFELYIKNEEAAALWAEIMDAGAEFGIKPIGLGARDTLRMEMGYCLYGNDITDTTSPLEAGLGWITKLQKDFIAADLLRKQKEKGLSRKLVGFKMEDKGIPRSHYPILDESGAVIGEVTSGTSSPSMGIGIGLGYVAMGYEKPGSLIFIEVRGKKLAARVEKLPLYKPV